MSLQLFAIFSAVSSLSPVSIHTLMLALRKSAIVSGTNYYNLSSTAVAPIRCRSLSNGSINLFNSIYLFSLSPKLLYFILNYSYSWGDSILVAINNVLSPILENSSNF
jgi:hypothetical protein